MVRKDILNWLDNIKNEKRKVLFMYGDVGIGKFTFLKENLEKDYTFNTFTYIDFLSRDIITNIININNFKNVMFMLNKKKKPIIIIKEVEFIKISIIKKYFKRNKC